MPQHAPTLVQDASSVDAILDAAFLAPPASIRDQLRRSEERRRETGRKLRLAGKWSGLAALRLKESVLQLMGGLPELAFSSAHEAWTVAASHLQVELQALVLTQLGACFQARGDLRGALRAVRRSEALLVSRFGEALPQVLVVRSQLTALLRASGAAFEASASRLERTYRMLAQQIRDIRGSERHYRLGELFLENPEPPTWAETYHQRWRNVYGASSRAVS